MAENYADRVVSPEVFERQIKVGAHALEDLRVGSLRVAVTHVLVQRKRPVKPTVGMNWTTTNSGIEYHFVITNVTEDYVQYYVRHGYDRAHESGALCVILRSMTEQLYSLFGYPHEPAEEYYWQEV